MPLIVVCAERALSCVKDGDGPVGWGQWLKVPAESRNAHGDGGAAYYLRPDQGRRVTQA